jgi:hypothetical protein
MTKPILVSAGLAVALACWLAAAPAYALNEHSWVSSTGTGSACTRAAPCSNFATAQTATSAGGIVSVVDPGEYGGLAITKSLTIRAEGAEGGGTATPALGLFWIDVQAGPNDVVVLEGLHFSGAGGVRIYSAGHMHIVRCVFANGNNAADSGVKFAPNSPSKLSVTDTVILNEGLGTGGGIVISPQAGGGAQVNLERVVVNGNAFGIAVDGTGSTAGINMTIADSMVGGNSQDGIVATTPAGGAPVGIYVKNTKSVNNNIGIRSIGTNVTVRVDGSSIIGNSTGLSSSGGGALLTFGNNAVQANGANGSFSGMVTLQ